MSYTKLLEDFVIKQWLDEAELKPNTVDSYLMGFQKYVDFTGMSPNQLLDEAEDEADRNVKARNRSVLRHIREFKLHLEKSISKQGKPYAPRSIADFMNSVISFYNCMYIDLPKLSRKKRNQTIESLPENKIPLKKEDMQAVLKVCDPLERAVVLCGAASGLSLSDLTRLRVCDFVHGYDKETEITTLMRWDGEPGIGVSPTPLIRKKTGISFITFTTPEASRAIWDYLAFRNRKPGTKDNPMRRRQLLKQSITRDEGYLFVLKNVSDDYLDFKDGEPHEEWLKRYEELIKNETDSEWQRREDKRQYHEDAFIKMYQRLASKSGKLNPRGWNPVRSHNMRIYFSSTLKNARSEGFDNFFIEYVMGHKPPGSQGSYFFGDPEQLKEKYKACIPFLTIQKEINVVESPEYKKLLKENKTLLLETERHVVERQELQDLRRGLEAARQRESDKVDRAEFLVLQHELEKTRADMEDYLIEERLKEENERVSKAYWESRSEEERLEAFLEELLAEEDERTSKTYEESRRAVL